MNRQATYCALICPLMRCGGSAPARRTECGGLVVHKGGATPLERMDPCRIGGQVNAQ